MTMKGVTAHFTVVYRMVFSNRYQFEEAAETSFMRPASKQMLDDTWNKQRRDLGTRIRIEPNYSSSTLRTFENNCTDISENGVYTRST